MTSRKFSICTKVYIGAIVSSILISVGSNPVLANDKPGLGIEEITVTATRRATSVQSTAAAITALGSEDLAARSIDDIESLGQLNASTDVSIFQGEAQVYIRGIGYSGIIGGTDSSTALHIDGVYMSRSSAAVPGFFDVERVEVVRGPQGTLYGRNATSGSVNIITKKPSDEFEMEASMLVGDYSRFKVFGALSGPIGESGVKARLAVQTEKRDGYTTLVRPVTDPIGLGSVEGEAENKDDIMARLTLQFEPSENVDVTLTGDYYEADDAGSVWLYLNRGTGTNPFMRGLLDAEGHFLPEPFSRRIESDLEHFNKPKIWGITNRIDWDLNGYTLTSLSAYKKTNPLNRNDLDATGGFGVDQLREEDHKQFSQEFQLSSPAGESLEWILGMYYFDEENVVRNEYFLPFVEAQFGLPTTNCCLLRLNGVSEATAYAVFGEATYDLSDNLELVLGGRYSSEERGGANDVTFQGFLGGALSNVATFEDEDWQSFTPKIGLNYQLNDDVFVYGSVSEGFKAGGFNIGSYQNTPFDPEEILSYELGVKADLLANRLRVNSAIFYYDYTDLQIQDVENNNTVVRNAANAAIQGIEIEGTSLLTEGLQLDFSVTYLDAEFEDVMLLDPKAPALGIQDLAGNSLPRAPELKYVLGLQYTMALNSGGSLMFRGDYKWQDDVFFSAFNNPVLGQESYEWAKARVAYQSPEGKWEAAAFIDNITDVAVATNATFNGDIIDSTVTGNMAPPRTWGMEIRYQF